MEIILVLAITFLLWLAWQLFRAKQFNRFKTWLAEKIKPKVINALTEQLLNERCEQFPNTDVHIEAAVIFWTKHPIRILQWALEHQILDEEQLKKTGHWRNCQHLFHIQQQYKVERRYDLSAD